MKSFNSGLITLLLLTIPLSGCISETESSDNLILATTTSMRDSGLLDSLLPAFTSQTGIEVDVIAVGTGAALNLGRSGDADILIVHAPKKEIEFIEDGHAESRNTFAWNRFVILSPGEVENLEILEFFNEIREQEMCFISRGDNSGTHVKEQDVWRAASVEYNFSLIETNEGVRPEGDWYYSIGQGMGAAITMADQKNCVTLSDKGTAVSRSDIELRIYEFESVLTLNPYSAIPLSGDNSNQALELSLFLSGNTSREIIQNFTINDQFLFNYGVP